MTALGLAVDCCMKSGGRGVVYVQERTSEGLL
jgi:hypothetical protein